LLPRECRCGRLEYYCVLYRGREAEKRERSCDLMEFVPFKAVASPVELTHLSLYGRTDPSCQPQAAIGLDSKPDQILYLE